MFSHLKKIKTSTLVLTLALIIFTYLIRWNHFTAPMERDEGVYSYSAWLFRQGVNPYEYSFPYKPPMVVYTYALGQILFGDEIYSPRIMAFIATLISLFFMYKLVIKEYGEKAAWLSVFFLSSFLVLPVNFGNGVLSDIYYAANTEIFMILPIIIVIYLYVQNKNKNTKLVWVMAGIFSAIAIYFKPIAFLLLAYIQIVWLYGLFKRDKNLKDLLVYPFLYIIGFASATFIIFFPVVYDGYQNSVWDQLVGFTSCYKSMGNWDYSLRQFFSRILVMGRYYWSVFLLIIFFVVSRMKNWRFYFGLILASYLSSYQSIIGHYYIIMMPALALMVSASVIHIQKKKWITEATGIVIFILICIPIIKPLFSSISKTPQDLSLWIYGYQDQFYESEIVGKKIQELTNGDDYIYVEGMDPQIIYFAQRRHIVKTEWTNFLLSTCPSLAKYNEEYIKDVLTSKPKVISLCLNGSCGDLWKEPGIKDFMGDLKQLVESDYALVGGWVPGKNGGYWLDDPENADINVIRTAVYLRKE